MEHLTPQQVDRLATRVEHQGGELVSIEVDLDQLPTIELIEEIRNDIHCRLERVIQSAVTVQVMVTNSTVMQFYCHMTNETPDNHRENAALSPGTRTDVSPKDLETICRKLTSQSATSITVRREALYNEEQFYGALLERIKKHTEAKFCTAMTVRLLATYHQNIKQIFVCFKEYGDFHNDTSLGPLEK